MMIHSRLKDYEVKIEENLQFLDRLFSLENTEFIIDKNVYSLYQDYFQMVNSERLLLIEATEENKVIGTALDICERMTEIPAKRNATIVSIGGGIIQDITGFVANILYRGVRWIFVPTTLLASCDSCIGGKTSLNYKKYKNLLGTFYPPDEIHICSAFFATLTDRDYKSGLGEVVKFNIMADQTRRNQIAQDMDALLERKEDCVNRYVESSLLYKKGFIEIDEFDRGERIKLNFAHTFGHAIEVITEYEIPHGTAVAMGMIMANSVSLKRKLLSEEAARESEQVLLRVIDIDPGLLNVPINRFLDAMQKDKKQTGKMITAVLLTSDGLQIIHDMTAQEVAYAVSYFLNAYADTGNKRS